MQYDEELARMRAQMLADRDEEPPIFDDGARYLGQDPNMMPVAWFGRPKKPAAPPSAPPVNLQRRSILGLTPMPAELPAVVPPAQPKLTPQQMEQAVKPQATFPGPHPDVWAGGPSFMSMGDLGDVVKRYTEKNYPASSPTDTNPSANPLQSLADKTLNAPISRREVLKKAGQAALQQVLPTPSISDVVPQVISPLASMPVDTDTMESLFPSLAARFGMQDAFKRGAFDAISSSIVEGSAPLYTIYDTYDKLRAFLEGNIPEQDLARMDKLQGSIDWDQDSYFSGNASSKSVKNVEKLFELFDKYRRFIPDYAVKEAYLSGHADKLPFEDLQDFVDNNFSGTAKISPEDLQDYWQTLEPPPPPPMPEKVKAIMKKLGSSKPKSKSKGK